MAKDDDILKEAREAFEQCVEAEAENRNLALDDLKFARLAQQWPDDIVRKRQLEGRPCLTINRLPSFIRQVVNDARQNKPSIKVRPVDDTADVQTAEIINGLIRNIEYTSNADVAYDTAAEFAVTMGWGYFRISVDYAYDDTFDRDIRIERVSNPFSVYGDPHSTEADSSDWNIAFVTELIPREQFRKEYKGAEEVNWDDLGYNKLQQPWAESGGILVAEYWQREKVTKTLLMLSNGEVLFEDVYARAKDFYDVRGITVQNSRPVRSHKITHRIMTGAEVLETNEWAGRYIPIIPVYGEEVNVEGKRYFRSLIRDAKDAQRMFNYWRTTTTELVALAPKAPFIGPKGSFSSDAAKWETINTNTHAYVEYDVVIPGARPERQPFAGVPAGALQEALNASDDMKAIMGLYDASLGARSNETSGRAILARQREGDVSTFHFIDNLSRAIRHAGRVLIDLIPHVYDGPRIVRVLGPEGEAQNVPINQPVIPNGRGGFIAAPTDQPAPPEGVRVFDLTAGKYDLTVEAGPLFTTRREEAVAALTELVRAFPQAAPVVGDLLVKMMDFPNADEIARRLQSLTGVGVDPQAVRKMQQELETLRAENAQLKADKAIEAAKVDVDRFKAETERIETLHEITKSPEPPILAAL